MRVIVQPFFIDAAPIGITAISAASIAVAITNRARDGACGASFVFVAARLLRVRIFASWPWRRCLGVVCTVSCKTSDNASYGCNWLFNREL
jgi:hypothetical protein